MRKDLVTRLAVGLATAVAVALTGTAATTAVDSSGWGAAPVALDGISWY